MGRQVLGTGVLAENVYQGSSEKSTAEHPVPCAEGRAFHGSLLEMSIPHGLRVGFQGLSQVSGVQRLTWERPGSLS